MHRLLSSLLFFAVSLSVSGQTLSPIVDSIPMRDGKKLAADIYIPSACTTCPVILIQTPYNRLLYRTGLPLGIGTAINSSNYIFVIADWRGFFGSADAFVSNPERGKDGFDIIEWVAAQTWSNGKVGTWGASALGKVQYETARENPSALKCAVPIVSHPQFRYFDYFPAGVLRTEYVEQLDALGYNLSPLLLANPLLNTFWFTAEAATFYPSEIKVPMLMIAGWYDHNTKPMIDFFNALRSSSPVRNEHRLVIGPWAHGKSGVQAVGTSNQGELDFPEAENDNDSLALLFFDYHLRNITNSWDTTSFINYFQMGENTWMKDSAWPLNPEISVSNLFFYPDGTITTSYPQSETDAATITYDPRDPSPTTGGATLRNDLLQGPYDQSALVESRNDILTFSTVTLTKNVQMKGYARVHFDASSDRKDTDFAARLVDVYPDGRSMLLSEGIFRARFYKEDYTTDTVKLVAGKRYHIDIDLPELAHTFLPGHKIRVAITSSNYPRFDRNLNNGDAMYVAGDTLIATNTIYLNKFNYGYLEIRLVDFFDAIKEESVTEFKTKLFPNPAMENATLSFSSKGEYLSLSLFDFTGKELMKKNPEFYSEGTHQKTFDLTELSAGLYFLRIENDKGIYHTSKLNIVK